MWVRRQSPKRSHELTGRGRSQGTGDSHCTRAQTGSLKWSLFSFKVSLTQSINYQLRSKGPPRQNIPPKQRFELPWPQSMELPLDSLWIRRRTFSPFQENSIFPFHVPSLLFLALPRVMLQPKVYFQRLSKISFQENLSCLSFGVFTPKVSGGHNTVLSRVLALLLIV